MAGLVGIASGQLLEIIGARVDEPGSSALEAAAHTAGQVVTTISLVLAALGLALVLVAAARDRAIPRWLVVVVMVIMAVALGFMIIGDPFAS